jgi:hypothetical protein
VTAPASLHSSPQSVSSKPSCVLALRKEAAAQAISVSDETFDKHVRPSLPVVRVGSLRLYPVSAIEAWLAENAEAPADELRRLTA